MLTKLLSKFIGNRNQRLLRQFYKTVAAVNQLEPRWQSLSDEDLAAKTVEFRTHLQAGVKPDSLLAEAFATVREASRRVLGMRHFDVQLIGGMVLHSGNIAEMRTGEGKTLVATLPAYLNALSSRGVHIVTVNDYLAQRDASWMAPVYRFLGLSTGVIKAGLTIEQRKIAYAADITYGTNNEFGFDYLRDNMAFSQADKSQRELHFAIIDEVDSILIDEARTPLIISGASEESSELYLRINHLIPQLSQQEGETGDYNLDEKTKQAHLTEQGHQHLEQLLVEAGLLKNNDNLYSSRNISLMHHAYAALRACHLFHRDVDYIVQQNQIIIVDEHTGRLMPGRRWSDGLHQAIEAKEQVPIQNENQTLASITFQNYFRLYEKLSGMTGTADTEAYEFQQIYNLEVVVIPTNQTVRRKDFADKIYLTTAEKCHAIIADIQDCRQRNQPVLVGTASIESSEDLSKLLHQQSIPHQVLNAKFHEKEAQIISEAGRPGAVTIATNMAGRGTDIVLGGSLTTELLTSNTATSMDRIKARQAEWQHHHDQVVVSGGLHIIGSERHESRRIDNQLRGRSGRQGDPGSSRFYLSLQDNLMRIFASERIGTIMQKLGMSPGEAIEHPWITKAIENAQRKVEGRNFDIRKQLLEFDDVANEQRKVIYQQRNELLAAENISMIVPNIRVDVIRAVVLQHIPMNSLEEHWDVTGLETQLNQAFNLSLPITQWLAQEPELAEEVLLQRILEAANQTYATQAGRLDPAVLVQLEKSIMLQALDSLWKEHLAAMEYLRQGIHLRGYAQKDPKQEYKQEAFELFTKLLEQLKYQLISHLSRLEDQTPGIMQWLEQQRHTPRLQLLNFQHPNDSSNLIPFQSNSTTATPITQSGPLPTKVGRNEACPCGSGKKYKQCHGKLN